MANSIPPNNLFAILADISTTMQADYANAVEHWTGSPFEWITKIGSSKRKGKIGELLVERFCSAAGLSVGPCNHTDYDRLICQKKFEIKFSTLWEGGQYVFQQLRNQQYDFIFCLGISPQEGHAWVIPKKVIQDGIGRYPGLTPQHGGKAGKDTAWLTVRPDSPQEWLRHYGGDLTEALAILKSMDR